MTYSRTCTNCGKPGHDYKYCDEPITSWGVIVVKKFLDKQTKYDKELLRLLPNIKIETSDDVERFEKNINTFKFLLVSRKHSLGYVEFIRGRYKTNKFTNISFLFKQMLAHEIDNIKNKEFDELWNDFWSNDNKKNMYRREYIDSKAKFDQLKENTEEFNLEFYVNNIKPYYSTPEWGFPKGRKFKNETDDECALREFNEETNITTNNINIFSNIYPIVENITGTNGIKYRHKYFLGEYVNDGVCDDVISHINGTLDAEPLDSNTECNKFNNSEIGSIGYYTLTEALNMIRDYHIEKKNILLNIFTYLHNTCY